MLTPTGHSAESIEKVMLLSIWARALKNQQVKRQDKSTQKSLICAGFGKPTYPIHSQTIQSNLEYWKNMEKQTTLWHADPECIVEDIAVDYGDPQGDSRSRNLMAGAMSKWYHSDIQATNVLFTVGGIGALHLIFETFNDIYKDLPFYRVITPFPYYSGYSNNKHHKLHPIDVMNEPGYQLTAKYLEASIKDAYRLSDKDGGSPTAVLICNPSNPLGTVINHSETIKIAQVLREYPELHIIFDEAYAEMSYVPIPSFLDIAPDLKDRVIIMRSATKGLSAAGERMAIVLAFNSSLMNELLNKNIQHCVHAPRSSQMAYAETMAQFNEKERHQLAVFYKKKIDYVLKRLSEMDAEMPDKDYTVAGTFYALGDFSDLLGLELPKDTALALGKSGIVKTGEDLAYYLLFHDAVMVAPLSYFGLSKDCGYIRITCSAKECELEELMDRLEYRLFEARQAKKMHILDKLTQLLPELKNNNLEAHASLKHQIAHYSNMQDNCAALKSSNSALSSLYNKIFDSLTTEEVPKKNETVV
jgi:aspartate/methionine/tyrosine aminotransferase